MSTNGPLMYRVKPLYDSRPNIILPTCMYKLNSIYDTVKPTNVVSNMSIKNVNQDDMKLIEFEQHQLSIIQKLEDLKEKVLKMTEELGVRTDKPVEGLDKYQDIVIKANPQNPPLSVWVFYEMFSRSVPTRLVTHLHSSLKSVPEPIPQLPTYKTDDESKISLTVIWRDGSKDHELVVNPIHQGPIEGEVNIARYLSRLLSFNYENDPVSSTLIDDWLEIAHTSVLHGNNKERQGILRSLNSHFGKSAFLVGDSLSTADIVMWSALIQTNLHSNLPANALKWFESLSLSELFQKCKEFVRF